MKAIRLALMVAMVAVLALSVTGCQSNKNVAARVNGEPITVEELDKQLEQLKKQYPTMFEGQDGEGRLLDFKQRLLDNLINQELVRQAAEEKGIKVSDSDVDKQVEQLRASFKDQAQFEQALKTAGMDVDGLKTQIREQVLTTKLIESLAAEEKVSKTEIKTYYDKNKKQFYESEAKRASHILFGPEDKATAEKVLQQVKDGSDFGALAKQYSKDTATASKGGDLGWPTTPYVTEFQTALDKLKKGQTSELVKSPYGWHIIRVTDERAGKQKSLEDSSVQIEQIIVNQRRADSYQKFLEDLRKKAEIEILLEDLKAGNEKDKKEIESKTESK